ncbi:MAG: Crp/Fnr family transcriptional regulator [Hyphomicrobiaceae bacterium]
MQINRIAGHRRIAAGRSIFAGQDDVPRVANIVSGVVKLSTSLPDGRTQVVGLLFASDFIGRPFSEQADLLTEAATDVELCCLDQRQFESLLQTNEGLREAFFRRVTSDLDSARNWMLLLGQKTAEERVASLIHHCYSRLRTPDGDGTDSGQDGDPFDLPLSRTEIAQFVGLTVETVSRMLGRLQSAGVIEIGSGRSICIKDATGLAQRAQIASELQL